MENMGRILVVDDEERIRKLLAMYLERNGYVVEQSEDGNEALQMALTNPYDLIVLDLMLPGMDGRKVCEEIRKKSDVPVIMLTGLGDETTRIQGFELGADDYVIKPFSPRELVMRVKAMLKRSHLHQDASLQESGVLTVEGLQIHMDSRKVTVDQEEVTLTPKEFELLTYLMQRPERVFSREELLRDVWNYQFFGDQRTVDTHVKRLREKLGRHSEKAADLIGTVWGVGYKFKQASNA